MNITEANKLIHGLNRIAEGATMLAGTIEEAAWSGIEDHVGMSGTRPITAAQLAQPALEDAAEEHEATRQVPDSEPIASELESVSLEDVRGVLAELSAKGLRDKVRELIVATGVDKLSAVDPTKYGWLLSQAEGLSDDSD